MKKVRGYTVVVTLDEESGAYSVSVPALRGCHTWGSTVEEAFEHAEEAIRCHLGAMKDLGEKPPVEVAARMLSIRT